MFLDGINLSDDDRATFRAKLSENGTTQENAELVDEYAVSYDNDARYPNPKYRNWEILPPQIDLQPKPASDEDVQELLDKYFP